MSRPPTYSNALNGSKFSGIVKVCIEDGAVTVTGTRSTDSGIAFTSGVLLLVFGAIGLVFGLVIAGNAQGDSDMGMAFACMGPGLLMLLSGIALYVFGHRRATQGETDTVRFDLAQARGRKVRYDADTGCLWSLLVSPLIGLIIMLVRGRRLVRMTIPADPGSKARRQNLVLKTLSAADGAILDRALRG